MGLETKELFRINADDFSYDVEAMLEGSLIPYQKGIYLAGRDEPIMKEHQYYYRIERSGRGQLQEIPIQSMEDIRGDVFDQTGEVILTSAQTRVKHKILSLQPTVPVYGRKIIMALVQDILARTANFEVNRQCSSHLIEAHKQYVKAFGMSFDEMEDKMYDRFSECIRSVRTFTGGRSWNIYIASILHGVIKIENTGDFRVYDWERRFGSQSEG